MRRVAVIAAAVVLTGCAVPTTGVVPRAEGLYTVTRQGAGAWVVRIRPHHYHRQPQPLLSCPAFPLAMASIPGERARADCREGTASRT